MIATGNTQSGCPNELWVYNEGTENLLDWSWTADPNVSSIVPKDPREAYHGNYSYWMSSSLSYGDDGVYFSCSAVHSPPANNCIDLTVIAYLQFWIYTDTAENRLTFNSAANYTQLNTSIDLFLFPQNGTWTQYNISFYKDLGVSPNITTLSGFWWVNNSYKPGGWWFDNIVLIPYYCTPPTLPPTYPPNNIVVVTGATSLDASVFTQGNITIQLSANSNGSLTIIGCGQLHGNLEVNVGNQTNGTLVLATFKNQCVTGNFDNITVTGSNKCDVISSSTVMTQEDLSLLFQVVGNRCSGSKFKTWMIAIIVGGVLLIALLVTIIILKVKAVKRFVLDNELARKSRTHSTNLSAMMTKQDNE